jgi:hypothetical protein
VTECQEDPDAKLIKALEEAAIKWSGPKEEARKGAISKP